MRVCDLRFLPKNREPYFTVGPDRALIMTITPDNMAVCSQCPNLHVRVLPNVTPSQIREFAAKLTELAKVLEQQS